MTKEIWQDITGYDGDYQVSNYGRVRSCKKRESPFVLKQIAQRNGYMSVSLWKNGRKRNFLVHRLVAIAFVTNPCEYNEINHRDENKQNNFSDNLEWCSHAYNMRYGNTRNKISQGVHGRTAWNKGEKCPDISARQFGHEHPHITKAMLRNNTSGIMGVSFNKSKQTYTAYIGYQKKHYYLGDFASKDEAIRQRLVAEKKFYGDQAAQRHLFEEYNI